MSNRDSPERSSGIMLYIYIDHAIDDLPKEYESHVSDYFDDVYEPEWFSDKMVKQFILEIDETKVVGEGVSVNLYNEVLGNIPPQYLSSGCKGLILLYKEGIKINGDRLGDNCIPLLLKIANIKDIEISLSHTPKFPDKFDAIIVNDGRKIHSFMDFVMCNVQV